MGGFTNPVFGGNVLIRPAIRSPNYSPGTSGWSINRNGSAELNDLTLRGMFVGTDWILDANGIFFYAGTPAAGNLAGAWAQTDGVDQFGNAYSAGITVFGPFGSAQLSADDGFIRSLGSSGIEVFMNDGALSWNWPGSASMAGFNIDTTARGAMSWESGKGGPNDKAAMLEVVTSNGVPVAGSTDTSPRSSTSDPSGGFAAHHYVSGAVVKSNTTATAAEVWQVAGGNGAAYNTNWSASTTFNASTGWTGLQYRMDAEDNLWITGCFKSAATAGGTAVITLPPAYRPKTNQPVPITRNNAGTLTTGYARVTAATGNLDLLTALGITSVASGEYMVSGKVPLGNIA